MRNPVYEQTLTKAGVKWEYRDKVHTDEINVARGKRNQARLHPIDDQLVERYRTMKEEGYEPPAIVLVKQKRNSLYQIDGNQRLAADPKRKVWDAYIVYEDDDMIIDRLTWTFNNLVNGRRMSYDECLEHAVTFSLKYGQPQEGAAKEWGVKRGDVVDRIIETRLRELAANHKIEIPKAFPVSALINLAPLAKLGEDVAAKAIKAATKVGMGVDDTRKLVTEVREARTHDDKMQKIDEFTSSEAMQRREAETMQGRRRPQPTPRKKLQSLLDSIEYLRITYKDKKAFKSVGKEEHDKYRLMSRAIINLLIEVYGHGALLDTEVA